MQKVLVQCALALFAVGGSLAQADWMDPCTGRYSGVWQFREGRDLQVYIQRQWGEQVTVTVVQRRGSETMQGICRIHPRGSARVRTMNGLSNVDLVLRRNGMIDGHIGGIGYYGRRF